MRRTKAEIAAAARDPKMQTPTTSASEPHEVSAPKDLMTVVSFVEGQDPLVTQIGSDLTSMQEAVDGYIEPIFLNTEHGRMVVVVDEDGRSKGKQPTWNVENRIIVGNFFICGVVGSTDPAGPKEDLGGLTPAQIKAVRLWAAVRWGRL